eukprot:scaffold25930_cov63-Phaeocystis_antarctica.AAC.4
MNATQMSCPHTEERPSVTNITMRATTPPPRASYFSGMHVACSPYRGRVSTWPAGSDPHPALVHGGHAPSHIRPSGTPARVARVPQRSRDAACAWLGYPSGRATQPAPG